MIILHEYPLHIFERPGFTDFVQTLQPQFDTVSINDVQRECVGVYLREKQRLSNILGGISAWVNLTLDLWTSDKGIGFLTENFIDNEWKLHKRILNVVVLTFPHSECAFNHAIATCLTDCDLENKLFTQTLDSSFANKTVRGNLKGLLSIKNPLILNGQLLMGNSYACVLSRLAQDALESMREMINKVRDSVKYVNTLEVHKEKFIELKEQLQVPSMKSLIIDNQTKRNSTYHMLVAASELKEVFSCLDTSDPNYKENPSMDEWKQVETLCIYLKFLFDVTNILTASTNPTANTMFCEVWKIQLKLTHTAMSNDAFIRNLTKPMKENFDKYWKDSGVVFAVAEVMVPKFKMKLVELCFSRIYGEDAEKLTKIVDEGLHELFLEYIVLSLPAPTFVDQRRERCSKSGDFSQRHLSFFR